MSDETETATRDENGLKKVWASPRPHNTSTYFTGSGDDVANNIIGGGANLIFKMSAADAVKTIDIEFTEDVWLKDGYAVLDQLPPLGSYMNIFVVHPIAGIVGCFGRKLWFLGAGEVVLDTDDRAKISKGLKIRIEVHNSDGIGDNDPPSSFVVTGRIEMFRVTTV